YVSYSLHPVPGVPAMLIRLEHTELNVKIYTHRDSDLPLYEKRRWLQTHCGDRYAEGLIEVEGEGGGEVERPSKRLRLGVDYLLSDGLSPIPSSINANCHIIFKTSSNARVYRTASWKLWRALRSSEEVNGWISHMVAATEELVYPP
ncbi:hypothetical protein FOZ62_006085, partial [Perkinsus olseni]